MLVIQSNSSDRKLIIKDLNRSCFYAELAGLTASGIVQVYVDTTPSNLNNFFQELASHEKPWTGKKNWESLDGELYISASSSSLGNVIFEVTLRDLLGSPEESTVSTGINTEWGQLAQIAKDAEKFFQGDQDF